MINFTKRHGTFASVVALTAALLIAPALAQTTTQPATPTPPAAPSGSGASAPSATPQTPKPAAKPTRHTVRRGYSIEARIKSLHDRLHITEAEEQQWGQVAQAMRENAATIEKLVRERNAKVRTMNAVDNLNTYAEIANAHADGLKKLVTAFDSLYGSMSEPQKKQADAVFRGIAERHMKRPAPKPAAPAQK
ncbi:MAG: Spy/CpxP family protein refolding chaperone [Alphaproteobacteria bacterium]|nr:Spy/CpxP family protein refolding chaperone [Alphaproteobacteria bacterium]